MAITLADQDTQIPEKTRISGFLRFLGEELGYNVTVKETGDEKYDIYLDDLIDPYGESYMIYFRQRFAITLFGNREGWYVTMYHGLEKTMWEYVEYILDRIWDTPGARDMNLEREAA